MGADRAVLVSDDARRRLGSRRRRRARSPGALERESADLVLFGQQSSDGDGAVLWAAVADRLRQAGRLAGRRAHGRGRLRSPGSARPSTATTSSRRRCRRSSPVSDAINEPRYPSLKGIMGAKTKPQETSSLGDRRRGRRLGGRGRARRRPCSTLGPPPARGDQVKIEDDGCGGAEDRRPRRREEAPVKSLVFLEHHGGELEKGRARRAREGGARSATAAGVVPRRGRAGLAAGAGAYGAGEGLRREATQLGAPLPQPRVDALATLVAEDGRRRRALRGVRARRRRRRRARRAPRRRPQLGPHRPVGRGRRARRQAAGARRHRARRRRLEGGAAARASSAPARSTRVEPGGRAEVEDVRRRRSRTSRRCATLVEQTHEESSGLSIEDADIIVAGGRGLGAPEGFTLLEELAAALGGAVAATRAVVDAGWYPYAAQVGQTGKTVSPKLYVACGHLRRDPAQGRHAGLGERSSRSTRTRTRRSSSSADLGVVGDLHQIVPKLTGARAGARRAERDGQRRSTSRPRSAPTRRSARRPIRATSGSRSASRSSAAGRRASPARSGSASCSRSTRTCASGSATCRSRCSRRASRPGSHLLSGAVDEPARAATLFRGRLTIADIPTYGEVPGEAVYVLTRRARVRIPPPPTMRNHGNFIVSRLASSAASSREQAEAARRGRPPGDVRDEAARRARPRGRRAHRRQGPRPRRRAAARLRAGHRRRRGRHGPRRGHAGLPHGRGDRPVRARTARTRRSGRSA